MPSMTAPGWFYPAFYLFICAGVAIVLVWRMRHVVPTPPSTGGLQV